VLLFLPFNRTFIPTVQARILEARFWEGLSRKNYSIRRYLSHALVVRSAEMASIDRQREFKVAGERLAATRAWQMSARVPRPMSGSRLLNVISSRHLGYLWRHRELFF
jgi:hypothetical protein